MKSFIAIAGLFAAISTAATVDELESKVDTLEQDVDQLESGVSGLQTYLESNLNADIETHVAASVEASTPAVTDDALKAMARVMFEQFGGKDEFIRDLYRSVPTILYRNNSNCLGPATAAPVYRHWQDEVNALSE